MTTILFLRDALKSQWRNPMSIRVISLRLWSGVALYILVIIVALMPDLFRAMGATPLTVAGVGVTLLVIVGVTLAWTYFVEPFASAKSSHCVPARSCALSARLRARLQPAGVFQRAGRRRLLGLLFAPSLASRRHIRPHQHLGHEAAVV